MAAPRLLDIIPNCGLQIRIKDPDSTIIDRTHITSDWKYEITNCDEIFATTHTPESVEGWLSPTHRITLPPMIKVAAGIPKEAKSFAFMYPPEGIDDIIKMVIRSLDSNNNEAFLDEQSSIEVEAPLDVNAIKSVLLLGGFVYFDDEFNCICVNAISREPSKQKLPFSGPFNVHGPTYYELHKTGRTHSLRLENFREVGFESFAWVRPSEKIQFKPVILDCDYSNGAFLFFREDRTAVAYTVNPFGYRDPQGNVGFISEAMANIGADFTQKVIQPIYDIDAWKETFKHLLVEPVDTAKLIETLEDKKTLLHMACHAALRKEFIADVLSNTLEMSNLSYQNSFGWNPLHYACRFSPSDCSLIKLLVNACPEAVQQSDPHGRCPLHIACDSDTSIDVITILLAADTSKVTILRKTNIFGLLPIHLACYKGAPNTIIEALLNADREGSTVLTKTKCGQLPLHLAILKQLPATMVKILLDAASKYKNSHIYADDDIYETFEEKLPLHIACWNNSPSEVIKMLLDKDTKNVTIHEPFGVSNTEDATPLNTHFTLDDAPFTRSSSTMVVMSRDTMAIHLAMKHGCKDVISLLLQKETENENFRVRSSTLYKEDTRGRTPLHIACEYSADPQIIQLLIELDSLKKTTQIDDMQGYRPMHYACENENISIEIINILCDSEEEYIKAGLAKTKKRSTHSGDTEHNRTPLFLAIKSGAPTAVIERFLQLDNFTTKGFDESAMEDLAQVVENSEAVQEGVVRILAQRRYFGIIMIDLYANILAYVSFWRASQLLHSGTITELWPSLLVFSAFLFLLREVLQILSVGGDYIGDTWSWNELLCIIFLLITAENMFDKIDHPEPELDVFLLSFTSFLLTVQIIFFLRSTFLPFAKFVGGLLEIVTKIIPFIIVSTLLLAAFIYSFWVNEGPRCTTFFGCYSWIYGSIFAFTTQDGEPAIQFLELLFGFMIVIVLLNVLIAIVSEAWDTSAKQSTRLFWKYRLQKIAELKFTNKLTSNHTRLSDTSFMRYIDKIENISYTNDISWSKAPYHIVATKDQYDNPKDYFGSDLVRQIVQAKSLQADIYWANTDARSRNVNFTNINLIILILKWLGSCALYALLIIVGILTCGFFFPCKFRSRVLSVGQEHQEESIYNPDHSQKRAHQTLSNFIAKSNSPVALLAHRHSTMDANSIITFDSDIPLEHGNHNVHVVKKLHKD